ncbi:glycosyltransferase [Flavobacterium sp. P21]|uniref:glycosyltransferase n=1 Tax=Flavobacterium sp. P21 TaxID=3423948 RepID=UPI003D67F707
MKESIMISIVIPCYNDWQYIEQAIDSALNQTYKNIEVIVVDDGSNSKTKEILKQHEPKIAKLITQENQGQSTARNVGIEASKGDYILVLDSDDFFEPTFCEKALLVLKNHLDHKLVSCFANLIFEDKKTRLFKPPGGSIVDFLFSNAALGTSMFRKEDWENCGRYDETMKQGFEDWEFFIRLLKNGGTAHIIPEPLYNYRKRNDATTSKANLIKYELLNYIFIKHKDLYTSNYDLLVSNLLSRVKKEEEGKHKILKNIEFRIGNLVLKPVRFIKSLL